VAHEERERQIECGHDLAVDDELLGEGDVFWCTSRQTFDEVGADSLKKDFTNCLPEQRVSERKQKNQTFGGLLRKVSAIEQS